MSANHTAPTLKIETDRDNLDSHIHTVQFYTDDPFLLGELSRFIGSALGAGDAGIVIATKAHRDGLAQQLKARGLDIDRAAAQGRYVSLDAQETLSKLMPDGQLDEARFIDIIGGVIDRAATAVGGERPRIAAFGEMVALLWAEGRPDAAIQLEQLWNGLASTHSFELLCAYPSSLFNQAGDATGIGDICATHTHVTPDESYTSLATEGERLRAITLLQQKARALETEIAAREKAQTALQHRERELLERNRQLREAIAARDEFLSVAAHELKTPITGLRGFAQLLLRSLQGKREIPPERLESALDAIERQTGKLNHLVSRLLDSAQIEAGKLRIEPVSIDLVTLVRNMVVQQQSANHRFVFKAPEYLEASIDPIRFEQVVTNLLDNAVQFSPQGGTVTVELEYGEGQILLSITDEGVGIPPHKRETVFDRFQQYHGERHLSGMGLGLYITREIIELHGGSIRVEVPEHPGTRFVVILPPANGIS
ncbi:MAG: ATP-binding protein [Chloroflexia bacterium]